MWPHSFAASYSASSEQVFRHNAVFLPLYQLVLLFVLFVGFAAVVVVPGLHDPDMALLEISVRSFPPWFVGVIGGTGVLTALVPGSLLLTTSATCLARNLFQAARPTATAETANRVARGSVPVLALIAMYFAISGGSTIVSLLLMGYALVAQLFPALLAALPARRRVTAPGAIAGIVVGVALVAGTLGTGTKLSALAPWLPRPVLDVHVGIFAVAVNAVVMLAVSALTRKPAADAELRAA
jgi:SSS family solute:Na+ symporter